MAFPTSPTNGELYEEAGRLFRWLAVPGVWESVGDTEPEADPTVPDHVKSITITDKSNWNNAYIWGNHNTAGYEFASNKGQPNGYASLDATGKLNPLELPPLAMTEVFVVANEAERLALVAQEGDVAIQTDVSITYIKNNIGSGTAIDWNIIEAPVTEVDPVFSASPAAGYTEAPADGTPYARQDLGWVPVSADQFIDGGSANSIYTLPQQIDGGSA